MTRALCGVMLASAALSGSLGAQKRLACDTAAVRASVVMVERTLELTITPATTNGRIPRPLSDELLDRVKQEFHFPAAVAFPLYDGPERLPSDTVGRGDSTFVRPAIYALQRIAVDGDGARTGIGQLSSYDANLDSAFFGAVLRVVNDTTWRMAPRIPGQDGALIDVEITVQEAMTSGARKSRAKKESDHRLLSVEFARIRIPHYPNGTRAWPVTGTRAPRYPDSMRSRGVEGTVRTHFIIDESGQVAPGTLWVSEATHADFAAEVRRFLSTARFTPLQIAGCPYPVRVGQPFNFNLVPR